MKEVRCLQGAERNIMTVNELRRPYTAESQNGAASSCQWRRRFKRRSVECSRGCAEQDRGQSQRRGGIRDVGGEPRRRSRGGQDPNRPDGQDHRPVEARNRRDQTSAIPRRPVPSIYSIVPPNDGSALRHGHHFEPVDFVIDHGRGHHDAYSAGSCQRTYARACGCRQRPRCHREELIESEPGWSGREAFVTMMQTADLGQGNDRSGPGRLNGSSIRCVLAERQVGP